MKRAVVAAPSGVTLPLDDAALVRAAEGRWPGRVHVRGRTPERLARLTLMVRPGAGTPFQLTIAESWESVSMDGTPEQNYATAAWVRSLMPADAPRVIVFDGAWTMHAELTYGCTAESLRAGTVDHSVPGWHCGDPDLY